MEHFCIDGIVFEQMLWNGLKNLKLCEHEINDMNVFPVPDGDTGTNMCSTLEYGLRLAEPYAELGGYLASFENSVLLGARGNSGVILSQIFKGISAALTGTAEAGVSELTEAFTSGYKTAYGAVFNPVEGTILTVVREGIECAKAQLTSGASVEELLRLYIAEMHASLLRTPALLPVLKSAGLVDSGALGYIRVLEGMLMALCGELLLLDETANTPAEQSIDEAAFTADSSFGYGYCLEFLLQLMNSRTDVQSFDVDDYTRQITPLGDSLIVTQVKDRIKVHIHTFEPEQVMQLSRKYGEFLTFKLDNMQLQNNEFNAAKKEHKPLALLAVADGEGFAELFEGLGCDLVVMGGKTMSVSVGEFIEAYKSLSADRILILPNDKNIARTAKQAAQVYGGESLEFLDTENMVQGYFSLASDMPYDNIDERIALMRQGCRGVDVIEICRSTRDVVYNGVECRVGKIVTLLNGDVKLCSDDVFPAVSYALENTDANARDTVVVFTGKDFDRSDALESMLAEQFPDVELLLIYGGQSTSELIIGVI